MLCVDPKDETTNHTSQVFGELEIKPTLCIQHNKRCHMKGQLNSFHLNGHKLGFHPHT